MDIQTVLGVSAVIIGFAGYVPYMWGIYTGTVKPHAFTWSIWGTLTGVAFFAQIAGDGGPGAWVTGFTAAMSFVFVAAGLTESSRSYIVRSDWLFFSAAIASIPLWYFSGDALFSVILISIIDFLAFIPTMRKAYQYPDTEPFQTYLLSGLKFIPSIFALSSTTVVTALYPASLVLANAIMVTVILSRRNTLNKQNSL